MRCSECSDYDFENGTCRVGFMPTDDKPDCIKYDDENYVFGLDPNEFKITSHDNGFITIISWFILTVQILYTALCIYMIWKLFNYLEVIIIE